MPTGSSATLAPQGGCCCVTGRGQPWLISWSERLLPRGVVCCNLLILWPVTVGLWHQRNHVQALWRNNQECHTLSQHCFASSWCVYSQRPTGCRRFIFFDLGAYLSSDFLRPPIKYSEDLKNFQKNKYTSNQHYVNPLQVPEAHITTK